MKLKVRDMVLCSMFIVLYVIAARLSVYVFEIPFSLQALFVLLGAMILKRKMSVISVCIYILMGLIGLPVFAQGSAGLGYLLKPSAGFLFGFLGMAFVVSSLLKLKENAGIIYNIVAGMAGILVQYAIAISYYIIVTNYLIDGGNTNLYKALALLFIPFIGVDCVKLIIAAVISPKLKKAIDNMK